MMREYIIITFTTNQELLDEINRFAYEEGVSRSAYIRKCIRADIKSRKEETNND